METNDRSRGFVPDFVRNAIQGSLRSLLSTEEGIRAVLKEVLPNELLGYVKEVIDAAKTEALRILANQTRDFLDHLDIDALAAHLVDAYRIKVRLDIELEPKKRDPMDEATGVRVERKSPARKAKPKKTTKPKA